MGSRATCPRSTAWTSPATWSPDDSAIKVLYLVIRNPQPNRPNVTDRTRDWKEAINTLAEFYGDRVTQR